MSRKRQADNAKPGATAGRGSPPASKSDADHHRRVAGRLGRVSGRSRRGEVICPSSVAASIPGREAMGTGSEPSSIFHGYAPRGEVPVPISSAVGLRRHSMKRVLTFGVFLHVLGIAVSGMTAEPPDATFAFREINDKSLGLFDGGKPVLVYNHGVITDPRVPKDDPRRGRSCYVHPVHGLNGEVLTGDFPKDHYHHHGVFWGWPHIEIDGRECDLWTGRGIQQRFVRWIERRVEPAEAVLAVENGWYVGEKKAMVEQVRIRAACAAEDSRAIDFDLTWTPVDRPITLRAPEGKSYGGLSVRFDVPAGESPRIATAAGVAKDDLLDTRLDWADLSRRFNGAAAPSGAAPFVPPSHPDFPPSWLARHYGLLSVGYPGVNAKTFAPGEPLRLSYRLWVHGHVADLPTLQRAYDAYSKKLLK